MNTFSSTQKPQISIVLPCFNPPAEWVTTLLENVSALNRKLPDYVIQYIISNDGSTRLARNKIPFLSSILGIVFVDNQLNEGKGSAIRKGVHYAGGDLIIYTDIDFPFGTDPIVEMVRVFTENPDCCFIYGNRTADYFKKLPIKRRVFSKILRFLNQIFLSRYITDTQAGIKGFRRNILPIVQETKTNSFVFEIELIRQLIKQKISIKKVEVFANPSIIFTDFSFNIFLKEAINFARIIIFFYL